MPAQREGPVSRYTFKWEWPDGETIIAKFTSAAGIAQLRETPCDKPGVGNHELYVVMDITQWGFAQHRWLAVHRCKHCGRSWAAHGLEVYDSEISRPF